ncbi:GntR family transcriptional regulator [Devosia geojensis]|uniref:GntR family transcriptional regulator n=1 Tax=Devosia geojensis TaxID=443610 RepID=A0A0F5FE85_9HYPH|nr:GntR family transcriptional regulator [Devosia geojensis]KKB07088.1 GntR family transcriptional regulator [Devosia geojensis]
MQNQAEVRLEKIDPRLTTTLRDHVHKALRMAIVSGRFPPQSRLNERQLAEDLGVSTTPLKEALRQLESEGLVSTLPRRGVVVLYGRAWAEEMILARAALESMIAHLAARRIGEADIAQLETTMTAMADATERADADQLIALNETFHDCIHRASRCEYLSRLIERQQFYDASTRRVIHADPEERAHALDEHTRIGRAIIAGDAETAERVMRDHVVRSGNIYLARVFPDAGETTPGLDRF